MSASICPTITASHPHDFRRQIEQVAGFATRLHIDLSDGKFSPVKLLDVDQVWWPGGVRADLHVMMEKPFEHAETYRALGPQLVIIQAEADGDFAAFAHQMHRQGIEVGVALLQATPVSLIASALDQIDHVMIFSGNLGHFGGIADLSLLSKVHELRQLKPTLEIGWDGGINLENSLELARAGVDVLNVGGFIHKAEHPEATYHQLRAIVEA